MGIEQVASNVAVPVAVADWCCKQRGLQEFIKINPPFGPGVLTGRVLKHVLRHTESGSAHYPVLVGPLNNHLNNAHGERIFATNRLCSRRQQAAAFAGLKT